MSASYVMLGRVKNPELTQAVGRVGCGWVLVGCGGLWSCVGCVLDG